MWAAGSAGHEREPKGNQEEQEGPEESSFHCISFVGSGLFGQGLGLVCRLAKRGWRPGQCQRGEECNKRP
jgi:hypothetical protein